MASPEQIAEVAESVYLDAESVKPLIVTANPAAQAHLTNCLDDLRDAVRCLGRAALDAADDL